MATPSTKEVVKVYVDIIEPHGPDFTVAFETEVAAHAFITAACSNGYVVHDHSKSEKVFERIVYPIQTVRCFKVQYDEVADSVDARDPADFDLEKI